MIFFRSPSLSLRIVTSCSSFVAFASSFDTETDSLVRTLRIFIFLHPSDFQDGKFGEAKGDLFLYEEWLGLGEFVVVFFVI